MPKYAPNKSPAEIKRRYFTLIRQGCAGAKAARRVGVSMSCGSLWFIDAGSVKFVETPISSRYLSQDDRIEIADGLAAGEAVKDIADRIKKSYQTVYRELPATANLMAATSRGMPIVRPICGGDGPNRDASMFTAALR